MSQFLQFACQDGDYPAVCETRRRERTSMPGSTARRRQRQTVRLSIGLESIGLLWRERAWHRGAFARFYQDQVLIGRDVLERLLLPRRPMHRQSTNVLYFS